MKRINLFIILIAVCFSTLSAQKIKHPSLLFTPQRVEAAKLRINQDTVQANAWNAILAKANSLLEKNDIRQMEYLALAYQMTNDKKYSEKLRQMLLDVAKVKSWSDSEMMMRTPAWRSELQMAHKSYQVAVAYDAIYNELSAGERKTIATAMYNLAVEPLLGDWVLKVSRIHSLNSMGHNWWSSCVGMGGLLALAISNEVSEARAGAQIAVESLPEWFNFAGDVLQNKPRTFDRDGGMYESINYASFGITEALILRMAWLNSHPGDKLEEIPQMNDLSNFFCNVAYPRTGELYSINFGDSHKNVTGESSMILAYAMGAKDNNALWYINQVKAGQHREGYPRSCPMGFLYTPDLKSAPQQPNYPLSKLWKDFGWATMRDSWANDKTMLAVKSGMTWNHSHADANSFILFHNGVDIIKDAGNCSYGKPEYRNYFFQSDAHNVVKFNGEGQSTYQQYHGTMLPGSVSSLIAGTNVRYVLADGTGPMSDKFARNFRHFLWIGNVILVIDDIKSHENGNFEWLWHPGGDAKKRGGDLEVTNGNSAVVIRPLYPQTLAPSNYVHDYPEMMYWDVITGPTEDLKSTEEYYSFKLPGEYNRIKAVTAIILKDSPSQKELPTIERREGKDWIGVRITENGKVTDVYINQLADGRTMHVNSWINADEWTTDAYLLTVSGNDVFVGYGSSLKRNDAVVFSSLSKLNMLAEYDGKTLSVNVEGQPRINMELKPSKNVSKLIVNHNESSIKTIDGYIQIKATQE
jgi:hypothetical protein